MNPSPTTPCLPPWGKVAPQGRMRGDLPLPPVPGQTRRGRRPRRPGSFPPPPFPGLLPAEVRAAANLRGGVKTPPYKPPHNPGPRHPPGRACPAPTARRPGNGCPRQPHSVSIPPSVGRGAPTPPRPPAAALPRANRRGQRPRRPAEPCAAANNSHSLPPRGKVAPQGRMRGRLPLTPIPRVTTRGDSRCRQHPRRGQDPSLRTEPLTGVGVTPRAGHARPLPRNNPTHLYTT